MVARSVALLIGFATIVAAPSCTDSDPTTSSFAADAAYFEAVERDGRALPQVTVATSGQTVELLQYRLVLEPDGRFHAVHLSRRTTATGSSESLGQVYGYYRRTAKTLVLRIANSEVETEHAILENGNVLRGPRPTRVIIGNSTIPPEVLFRRMQ
jgi:hypothetical protein